MDRLETSRTIAENLAAKRVVVMGLGRFGGGVGVSRFLTRRGADVLVTDLKPAEQLHDAIEQLERLPIEYRLGEHNVGDFTTADLIVVNPAVDPRQNRFLRAAAAAGVPLTTEIRLLIESLPPGCRTIGVTGTAGKSTVTAMIGHTLEHAYVGGNIGGSLLDRVDDIASGDWVVLELSSFMLEALAPLRWSPAVAVITNLHPNHLDRHGTFEDYTAAKQQIFRHQSPDDTLIVAADLDPAVYHSAPSTIVRVDSPSGRRFALQIPGAHNRLNAALAAAACEAAGTPRDVFHARLAEFQGLPHRLQPVCERAGVSYYNDSKATTPEAAQLAIASITDTPASTGPSRLHVILGGYDKGVDLTPLARYAAERCGAIYTIGATGPTIAAAAGGRAQVTECGTLDRAVAVCLKNAAPGDTVLLSPGCASWDQFEDFQQRGAAFTELVRKYSRD